ncbi:MAG: serine hydrolase [Verrucomicrobiota bacterium]|nr:serine hydrolase [Verrucomicrobiota bacterium]MCC6823956.1 serine hydrolase [Limisphaerales bacterium]
MSARQGLALLLLATTLRAGSDTNVVFPGTSWELRAPAVVQMDAGKIDQFIVNVGGDGCIVKDGYLVKSWGETTSHKWWASASKPVLSTLLLLAVQEGKLPSVDAPVKSVGWELSAKDSAMTFRHLANMVSGYNCAEAPGAAWGYNDFAIQLYARSLEKVFQQSLDAAFQQRLAALQFQDGEFFGSRNGLSVAASPRDFARLGWLWLNRGWWNGREVISEKLFADYIKPGVPANLPRTTGKDTDYLNIGTYGGGTDQTVYGPGVYGFNFWFNERMASGERVWPAAPADTYQANGMWNRDTVTIFPSLRMVVAVRGAKPGKFQPGKPDSEYNQNLKLIVGAARPMAFPDKDWEVATPESQGMDSAKLQTAAALLEKTVGKDGVHELMIIRNGRLIWRGDDIDKVHGVWSFTKAFTSTTLGLLRDDGKCALDTKAKDIVPALAAAYPEVTLRHFTTMTSGYRALNDEPRGTYAHGPSKTSFLPNPEPLFSPPGSKFAYWDSAMNEFANVLTHIAGEPLEELFRRRIADPIGMNRTNWDWGDLGTVDGIVVNGGSGNNGGVMKISARETARFGLLFLNRGNWNGKQLLSERWVDEASKVQVPASLPHGFAQRSEEGPGEYGFNWWINGIKPDGQRKYPGAPEGTYCGAGHNNNYCFIIPEWNMVIVRLGLDGNAKDKVWSDFLAKVGEALQ